MPKPLLTKKRLALIDETVREGFALQQKGQFPDAEQRYRAVLALHARHFDSLHMLATLCHQTGRHTEALQFLAEALKVKADSADAHSNQGVVLNALRRFDDAIASFDRAIKLKPAHAEAFVNRGAALGQLGKLDDALACYERGAELKPAYHAAHYNAGNALIALNRIEEALARYDRALALSPNNPETLNNRGNALLRLGRPAEALESYESASKTASAPAGQVFAQAQYNAGLARLTLGDFKDGWALHEWRWKTAEFAPLRRDFEASLWIGREPLAGRSILLHAEQGYGDILQFVRYVPMVAALNAAVVLEVPSPLARLLADTPGAHHVVTKGDPLPAFDFHCPLMSLPHALGTTLKTVPADVPYIRPCADKAGVWRERLAALPRPRVGITWAGRPTHIDDRNRSIPFTTIASLLVETRGSFVSLQRDVKPDNDGALRATTAILDVRSELKDFADTAALISELDLVISVDTSVAHLAGAMGRPVWLMLPYAVDFRWMYGRDDSPWYPTARLYRQPAAGDWDGVIARIAQDLKKLN